MIFILKNKVKIGAISLAILSTLSLAGCAGEWQGIGFSNKGDQAQTKQINATIKQLQTKTKDKQALNKQQWNINNQRGLLINQNKSKELLKLSNVYLDNQNQIINISSQINVLNQKLASLTNNHKTVDDSGKVVTYIKSAPSVANSTSSSSNE